MSQQAWVDRGARSGGGSAYARAKGASARSAEGRSLQPERPFQLYRDGELARPEGSAPATLTPDMDAPGMARVLLSLQSRLEAVESRVRNLFVGYSAALDVLSVQLLGDVPGNGGRVERAVAAVWDEIVGELRGGLSFPLTLVDTAVTELLRPERLADLAPGLGFVVEARRRLVSAELLYNRTASSGAVTEEFLNLEGLPEGATASHAKGEALAALDELIARFDAQGLVSCEDFEARMAVAFVTDPTGEGAGLTGQSLFSLGQRNGRVVLELAVEVRESGAGWDFTTGEPRATLFTAERTEAATRWLNDLMASPEGPRHVLDLLRLGLPVEVFLELEGDTDGMQDRYWHQFRSADELRGYRGESPNGRERHPALRAFWSGSPTHLFHIDHLEVGE